MLIDVSRLDDAQDAVQRAVQALAEGKVVAFPTDTVYGLAARALDPQAVDRLLAIKSRRAGNPLTLAIRNGQEALDYCPGLSPVGRRLARRCWPGPLTLVLDGRHPDGLLTRLPSDVRQAVSPSGSVGLRVPDHRLILSALRLASGPLVLTSANRSGAAEAVSGEEVVAALGNDVDLVLSDGRARYSQPSTVARVDGDEIQILRPGVLSEQALRRYASFMVLLVCTGNTCRSPMAQVLLQRRLAQGLRCAPEELEKRGLMILSAGVAAVAGGHASPEAVAAIQAWGLDLTNHETRAVTDVLVRFADLILTMTRGHRDALLEEWPEAAARVALVCRDQHDVADPIGGSLDVYRRCAEQLDRQLTEWAKQIQSESLPRLQVA
jgi:protein-tyrosine phosphatase